MQSYLCCFTQYAISFLNILSLMHFCCWIQFSFSSPISILFHRCNCANCSPPPSAPITLIAAAKTSIPKLFVTLGRYQNPFLWSLSKSAIFWLLKLIPQRGNCISPSDMSILLDLFKNMFLISTGIKNVISTGGKYCHK